MQVVRRGDSVAALRRHPDLGVWLSGNPPWLNTAASAGLLSAPRCRWHLMTENSPLARLPFLDLDWLRLLLRRYHSSNSALQPSFLCSLTSIIPKNAAWSTPELKSESLRYVYQRNTPFPMTAEGLGPRYMVGRQTKAPSETLDPSGNVDSIIKTGSPWEYIN